jgi:hypothetical protein
VLAPPAQWLVWHSIVVGDATFSWLIFRPISSTILLISSSVLPFTASTFCDQITINTWTKLFADDSPSTLAVSALACSRPFTTSR